MNFKRIFFMTEVHLEVCQKFPKWTRAKKNCLLGFSYIGFELDSKYCTRYTYFTRNLVHLNQDIIIAFKLWFFFLSIRFKVFSIDFSLYPSTTLSDSFLLIILNTNP